MTENIVSTTQLRALQNYILMISTQNSKLVENVNFGLFALKYEIMIDCDDLITILDFNSLDMHR